MPIFQISAQHTGGQSVSHPCRRGVFDDPADCLDCVIVADNDEQAIKLGDEMLREIVATFPRCSCYKSGKIGSDQWYSDICISIERTDEL